MRTASMCAICSRSAAVVGVVLVKRGASWLCRPCDQRQGEDREQS